MRRLPFFLSIIVIGLSCGKSVTPAPPDNKPPIQVPPASGTIAVTSWLPQRPYPSDDMTIEGDGFGNDAGAIKAELGYMIEGSFTPFETKERMVQTPLLVKSVTPSKLTVQVSDSAVLEMDRNAYSNNDENGKGIPNFIIRITVSGQSAYTSLIPYRRLLRVNQIYNRSDASGSIMRAGDSIMFAGGGFTRDKCDIKVYLVGPSCGSCSEITQDKDVSYHIYHIPGQCHCTDKTFLVGCARGMDFTVDSAEYGGYTTGFLQFKMPELFQHKYDGSKYFDWVTFGLIVEDGEGHRFVDSAGVYLYPHE